MKILTFNLTHSLLNISVINITRNKVQGQFSNVHEQGLSKMSKTFILDTKEAETSLVRKWNNSTENHIKQKKC